MAKLTYNDIKKRNNIAILANRINGGTVLLDNNNSPIHKCTGKVKITLKKASTIREDITSDDIKSFMDVRSTSDKFEIELDNRKYVNITRIYKDKEFGGAGAGSGTAKEDAQLESLKKQIKDAILKSGTDHIVLDVNGKKHKIIRAETTPGTPKSDFHLINTDERECVWISHKDGKTAKDFQQWGGVSKKEYSQTPEEVLLFAAKIKALYGDEMPRATTVAMKIQNDDLKNSAVYGIDYGKRLGRQNVSVLLQGEVSLKKSGNNYKLDSYNIHYNGEAQTGDFEPVLMAMYKGDRSNFDIKGARFGISPAGSRKVKEWL